MTYFEDTKYVTLYDIIEFTETSYIISMNIEMWW